MKNLARLIYLLMLSIGVSTNHLYADEVTVEKKVLAAMAQIRANLYDSHGATRKDLLDGITKLERLKEKGYESSETTDLLARAYYDLAIVHSKNSEKDKKKYLNQSLSYRKILYEKNPGIIKYHLDYAVHLVGKEKILELEKIVNKDKNSAYALYVLGVELVYGEEKEIEKGKEYIFKSLEIYVDKKNEIMVKDVRLKLDEVLYFHGTKKERKRVKK